MWMVACQEVCTPCTLLFISVVESLIIIVVCGLSQVLMGLDSTSLTLFSLAAVFILCTSFHTFSLLFHSLTCTASWRILAVIMMMMMASTEVMMFTIIVCKAVKQ